MALGPKLTKFDQKEIWNLPLNNCITYFGTWNSEWKQTERARARTIKDAERSPVCAQFHCDYSQLLRVYVIVLRTRPAQASLAVLSSRSLSLILSIMFPILLLSILEMRVRYQIKYLFFKDFKKLSILSYQCHILAYDPPNLKKME